LVGAADDDDVGPTAVPNLVFKLQSFDPQLLFDRPYHSIRIRAAVIIDALRALLSLLSDALSSMEKDSGHAFQA
jgi:hypothetical protein